jgi:hypothetical protein
MAYALSWFFVLGLLGLWSLASWALHSVAVWSTSNAPALAGQTGAVEAWTLPSWLAQWIPAEALATFKSALAAVMPAAESMLAQMPALTGGLSTAIWVLWAAGGVLLLGLGGVLHALIAMLRRRGSGPTGGSGGSGGSVVAG